MDLNKYDKIIDYDSGDLTGDGNKEEVYIVSCLGAVCEQNNFLLVNNKRTGNIYEFPLEKDHYKFDMQLISFRDSIKKEIFLRSISESFGGYVKCQIFSFENNRIVEIFNSNTFFKENKIMAFYRNNYELEVLNYERNKKYFVVLRENYKYYLDFVYDNSGKVKHEKEKANISRVWECYPFYQMGNKVASISILQKILGQSDSDNICYVQSIVGWKNKEFKIINQTVNLEGRSINQNYRNLEEYYGTNEGKVIIDTKIKRLNLVEVVKRFINKDSEVLFANEVDINNDGNKEIIAAYRYAKGLYLIILEEVKGEWGLVDIIKGHGYNANNNLVNARDLYEKYFENLIKYYSRLVDKNPSVPIYWYYLSNSQFISGTLEDALKSINMDLSFQYPYPSKEDALLLKEKIEVRLKKEKISRSLR